MDAVITQIQDLFEGQIDFSGQRITEFLSTTLLILTSIVALLVGFMQNDIHLVMWTGLAGTLLTMLIVVPPWPFYNQNPQPWIGSRSKMKVPHGGIVTTGIKVN